MVGARGFVVSVAVGLIFGMWPARTAASRIRSKRSATSSVSKKRGDQMTNATASPAEAAPGFFGILGNLFVAPTEAFAAILKRPAFWVPLLLAMAMNAAFSVAWLQRVDGEAFMKARFAENPRTHDMPADARAQAIEGQAKMLPMYAVDRAPVRGHHRPGDRWRPRLHLPILLRRRGDLPTRFLHDLVGVHGHRPRDHPPSLPDPPPQGRLDARYVEEHRRREHTDIGKLPLVIG